MEFDGGEMGFDGGFDGDLVVVRSFNGVSMDFSRWMMDSTASQQPHPRNHMTHRPHARPGP